MPILSTTPQEVMRWMKQQDAVLIDVREPFEHKACRIQGAISLPLSALTPESLPAFAGRKLVFHCQKGGRSGAACRQIAQKLPNMAIYNVEGGLEAWRQQGLPTEGTNKKTLTIDRQVQLVVGFCVLTGTLLGRYEHPAFLLLAGFFGAGLLFAGLSGTCGLALVLARMPWNKCPEPQP